MAKFIKKVFLFFTMFAIIDIACGFGFNYLRSNAKGGDTQKNYYISEQSCDDILILGSSRAARHYNPKVLEDSLHMSCYNCGEPGCGIITAYGRYAMMEQRHKPKLVIYEVTPGYDYFRADDYSKYIGKIRPYANKPEVYRIITELSDSLEKLRLLSNMYKNNSCIFHNCQDNLFSNKYINGFEPLYGYIKTDSKKNNDTKIISELDSLKLSYMERLIVDLQKDNVQLFLFSSPKYLSPGEAILQSNEYEPIIELSNKYNVPFINHLYIEGISDNRELFQDYVHLNSKGADMYSSYISSELISLLLSNTNNN